MTVLFSVAVALTIATKVVSLSNTPLPLRSPHILGYVQGRLCIPLVTKISWSLSLYT